MGSKNGKRKFILEQVVPAGISIPGYSGGIVLLDN